MTYPFVQATEDYGPRKGPVKAFVVHLAEGGGTVGFLSNPTVPRGVSVHYVVEYSGRVVQMLRESHASGSINPKDIRTTDDPDGFYGATVAQAVMGDWWKDPNAAVISCEVEGFAKDGPNAAQSLALASLVKDVRSRFPGLGLLGHRDFADYKACPGKRIDWPSLGGHGVEEDMGAYVVPFGVAVPFAITGTARSFAAAEPYGEIGPLSGTVQVDATVTIVQTATPHGAFVRVVTGTTGRRLIAAASGTFVQAPAADCSDAVAAEHERTRAAAIKAVEAIP